MPTRIKVTHIITMLELGGAQRNTLYTVEHLNPERFQCQLISGPGGILDEEAQRLTSRGIDVRFVPSLIRPVRPWSDWWAIFEIKREIKRFKPDIVHTHSSKAGILGRLAAKLPGVPVIIHTYHGFGFNPTQNLLIRTFYVWLEKIAGWLSKKLIFVSQTNLDEALDRGIAQKDKSIIIRSGIKRPVRSDENCIMQLKSKIGIPQDAALVSTIGPFKPQKNLKDFIRVAKLVCDKHESCRFVIVGDGEQRNELERMIADLSIKSRVVMTGWLKQVDLETILSASEVFVLTSLWEGLPRSLVEAMSLGLAAVCYQTHGILDLIKDGENGFLFKPGEIEPMARQIYRILEHEGMRRTVGKAAASSIGEEFDIDHMVRQQETLYQDLLASA